MQEAIAEEERRGADPPIEVHSDEENEEDAPAADVFSPPRDIVLMEPAGPEHPGQGWKRTTRTEKYGFDILYEDGERGPAQYIRFAVNQRNQPIVLGTEGKG
jgi:hypothetical protein